MKQKKERVCENLTDIKTKITIIGFNIKSLSDNLKYALIKHKIYKNVEVNYNSNSNYRVKNNDIYILKTENYSYEKIINTIKKIYQLNPFAYLFLIGENNLEKINEELKPFSCSINSNNPVKKIENALNNDFDEIIDCLYLIEETKSKISSLWKKMEKFNN